MALDAPPGLAPAPESTPREATDDAPSLTASAGGTPVPATPRVRRWPWRAAGLFVGLLGVGTLIWHSVPAPALPRAESLIVAVDNGTGDPTFDATLRLALAIQLELSPRLRALSDEAVAAVLTAAGWEPNRPVTRAVAGQVCQAAGAGVIMAGSIGLMGRSYVIGLEAVECKTGETFVRHQIQVANKEQVLQGVERAASAVRQKLVEVLFAQGHPRDTRLDQAQSRPSNQSRTTS